MARGRSLVFASWQKLHFGSEPLITVSKWQRLTAINQSLSLHISCTLSIQHYFTEFSTGSTDPITCLDSSVDGHRELRNACKSKQDISEGSAMIKCPSFYINKFREILTDFKGRGWEAPTEKALEEFSKDLTPYIVATVVKCTEVDMANSFFQWAGRQEGYKHSRYSYTMLFRNFVRAQNFVPATQILKEMKDHDFTINPKTFVTLAHHCGKAGMMSAVLEIPDLMKSLGFVPDHRIYTALLNAFLQANDQDRANELIQKILDEDIMHDTNSFNDLLSTCVRGAEVGHAVKVLKNMEKKDCSPNIETYNILMKWLCRADELNEALEHFRALNEKGLVPNSSTYNCLIQSLCNNNRVDEASDLLLEMNKADYCPDRVTHNCLLSGYWKSGQIEKGLLHLEKMSAEGCIPMLDYERMRVIRLCQAKMVDKALQIFETTSDRGDRMFPDACNSILFALCKNRRLDDALKMVEKMQHGVCDPDNATYFILLRCCCGLHKLGTAMQLYYEAKGKGLHFSEHTYVMLLHAFSRESKFREIDEICGDLLDNHPILLGNEATAVLDALNIAQRLDEAVKFCNHAMENNLKIHPRQLNRLTYLLHRKGRSSEASDVSREMVEKGCVIVLESLDNKTV